MTHVRFGVLDGNPVRFTPLEAYWFVTDQWVRIHPHEVGNNAHELSERAFNAQFPELPTLPDGAFIE